MKKADKYTGKFITVLAAVCFSGAVVVSSVNAAPPYLGFDSDGGKIYNRFNETPLAAMTGTDGARNLNSFYELRQYPGSPPRIPHDVAASFSGDTVKCLSCHGRGGFDANLNAYAPVTPHPENENCYQCHVPRRTEKLFVESNWQSISPPVLGRSQMGGSPPPIPHSLQLREDCIACHTGPAAVAEIRVEHGSRGNCRQCHLPMPASKPTLEFTRK
jgi:cytochrome c-type protein NapB